MDTVTKKGFTLIELLVVIAIIALLLAILMPALAKVKEQAQIVICKTNLRQLSLAFETYRNDHKGKPITTGFEISPGVYDGHLWFLTIAPYLSDSEYYDDPTANMKGSMKVLWCPSTKEPLDPYPAFAWGDFERRWRYHGVGLEGEGSYGINMWVGGMDIDTQIFYEYISPEQASLCSYRGSTPPRPDTPVFADSNWMGGIPMDLDQSTLHRTPNQYPPPYENDLEYTGDYLGDDIGMRRFCIDRHNMAINIVFADGQIRKVKLVDLWSLRWNNTFRTIRDVSLK